MLNSVEDRNDYNMLLNADNALVGRTGDILGPVNRSISNGL